MDMNQSIRKHLSATLIWFASYLGNGLVKMIGNHTRRIVEGYARK